MAGRKPGPSTPHGHYARASRHGCRCEPCLTAYRAYNRERYKASILGVRSRLDAAPIRVHVQRLVDEGLTPMQIQAATGHVVNRTSIKQLLGIHGDRPASREVSRKTAAALLAVQPGTLIESGALVDGTGARRRLQALVAIGYELGWLWEQLKGTRNHSNCHAFMYSGRPILAANAAAVRRLYDELSMTPGPSNRARSHAARRGWVPPLAWDDEAIDDPNATPADSSHPLPVPRADVDEVAVARAIAGEPAARPLTTAERRAVITALHARGLQDPLIAAHTGLPVRAVLRTRQALRLPAVAA